MLSVNPHRIFLDQVLTINSAYELPNEPSHHISVVLRMRKGQQLIVFNGRGGYFLANIINVSKKCVFINTEKYFPEEKESVLRITLVQGISRGQRMDYTIQKSVELGVARIVPVLTEYCTVKVSEDNVNKKHEHWRKIIIGACEQCGRNTIPVLEDVQKLSDWISIDKNEQKIILHPNSDLVLSGLDKPGRTLSLLIGPEGGFSKAEYESSAINGYVSVKLGPRILRTETAALAAISACQTLWGDL